VIGIQGEFEVSHCVKIVRWTIYK